MRKIISNSAIALFAMFMLCSCSSVYTYYQVFKASPANNLDKTTILSDGVVYKDANCEIYYSFWGRNGNASFLFLNSSDSIIYIDMKNTFFINGGRCYNYYEDRSWTKSVASSVSSSSTNTGSIIGKVEDSFNPNKYYIGYIAQSNSASYTVNGSRSTTVQEPDIIAIAPKSFKVIRCNYDINSQKYMSCDIKNTDVPDSLDFNQENTPIRFSNYITYKVGKTGEDKIVDNQFYVSQVKIVPYPCMFKYIEFYKFACPENLPYTPKRYNRVVNVPSNQHFYVKYTIRSKRALYKNKDNYIPVENYYMKNH